MTFLDFFQATKRIFGFCPCCNKPFRLSEVTLFTKRAPPKTPFDQLAEDWASLEEKEARLEERLERIREASREAGRRSAKLRLSRIARAFISHKIHPRDVKALFDPVDYVAFCGLGERGCKSIDFIDRPPETPEREVIHKSLATALSSGRLEWHTYRVTEDGKISREE